MQCKCCNRKDLTEDDFYWRKGLGIKAYSDCRRCVSSRISKKHYEKTHFKPIGTIFNVDDFAKQFYSY